jgi:hypothetical protein
MNVGVYANQLQMASMNTQPMNFGIINNRAQQQRTAPSTINMCAESSGINAPMMRIGDAQINKEEGNNAFLQQMTIQTETDQASRRIGEGKEQSCKDIVIPENAIEQVGEDHFPLTIDQVDEHHWLFLLYIKSDQSKFDQNEFLDTERNLIKVANKQMGASIYQSRFLHNTVLKNGLRAKVRSPAASDVTSRRKIRTTYIIIARADKANTTMRSQKHMFMI